MSKNNSIKKRSWIFYLIYLILLSVFLFSAFHLISYFSESKKGKDFNENLLNEVLILNSKESSDEKIDASDYPSKTLFEANKNEVSAFPDISVDFSKLKNIYKDCVAWIYCPGTCINYPVMQGNDNDYYLHKLPDGTDNFAGSIFMDFQDNKDLSLYTTTIYGHNLNDQTMFTPILKYRKDGFLEEHPYIFYFTEDRIYRLEVFAGVNTTATSDFYKKPITIEEFNRYLDSVLKKSCLTSEVDISSEDKVMCLSTCSGGAGQEYRFILYCKIVPIEY